MVYSAEEGEELVFFRWLQRKPLSSNPASKAAPPGHTLQATRALGSSFAASLIRRIYWGCVIAKGRSLPSLPTAVTTAFLSSPNSEGSEHSVLTAGPRAGSSELSEVSHSADMPASREGSSWKLWA